MDEPHDVDQALVSVGERCTRTLRLSRDEIADFARITGDTNPLHFDLRAAQRARHGEIIASGQQVSSMLIGLASSYFSRADDQVSRELLCLNFNFAFKAPVFAEQDIEMQWTVGSVEWSSRLQGWIGLVDGNARVGGRVCVIGRGTVLVKAVADASAPDSAPAAPVQTA